MRLSAWNDRWRTFADATALALGINLWVSLVLLPGLVVHAFAPGPSLVMGGLPLLLLFYGVWRRNEVVLLFGFPSALLVPIAMAPNMASMQVYGPARFAIVALGLLAFLFSASALTSFYEPPAPRHVRPLKSSQEPISPRWRRRFRMYALLSLLSFAYPLILLHRINFDEDGARALAEFFPGRAATFTTLLNVVAIAVWLVIFSNVMLAPLKQHRTGDKELQRDLAVYRGRAAGGSPRLIFYLGGVMALVLMAIWFVWRG